MENRLTHFSQVLHFTQKLFIYFALQNRWLVSIWNATTDWNGSNSCTTCHRSPKPLLLFVKDHIENQLNLTSPMLGHRMQYHQFQSTWFHYPLLWCISKHSIDSHTPILRPADFLKTRKKGVNSYRQTFLKKKEIRLPVKLQRFSNLNIYENKIFGLFITDYDLSRSSHPKFFKKGLLKYFGELTANYLQYTLFL